MYRRDPGRYLRRPLARILTADPDRDRFILSKGHAALALYAVLASKGWISYANSMNSARWKPHRRASGTYRSGVDFSTDPWTSISMRWAQP